MSEPYRDIVIGDNAFGEAISLPVEIDDRIRNFGRFHAIGYIGYDGELHQFKGIHMTPAEIASITHEANRQYQEIIGEPVALPWLDASEHQRASVIDGVKNALANPDLTPRLSHQNWLAFKVADGWTYGPAKDEATKQHPCCVPYDELPAKDRVKDELFLAIVRALETKSTPSHLDEADRTAGEERDRSA